MDGKTIGSKKRKIDIPLEKTGKKRKITQGVGITKESNKNTKKENQIKQKDNKEHKKKDKKKEERRKRKDKKKEKKQRKKKEKKEKKRKLRKERDKIKQENSTHVQDISQIPLEPISNIIHKTKKLSQHPTTPPTPIDPHLPLLYREAAHALSGVHRHRASLRTLDLSPYTSNKNALYALVAQTIKSLDWLDDLLGRTNLVQTDPSPPGIDPYAVKICVYELLRSRSGLAPVPTSATVTAVLRVASELRKLAPEGETGRGRSYLRYVRVNTLKTPVEDVVAQFIREGYCLSPSQVVAKAPRRSSSFCVDEHVPDVLVFPQSTNFHHHPLVSSGTLFLQDKASCFPVHSLAPSGTWHVIDACAAPGIKTTHVSALLRNRGKVFAIDCDLNRLLVLRRNVSRAGCRNVVPLGMSFLDTDPGDPRFHKVRAILLDPSCSGSGTLFYHDKKKPVEELVKGQIALLLHALGFPQVERVVYSTCSVDPRENEEVVKECLIQKPRWELKKVFPEWPRRGMPVFEGSDKCLRTDPEKDMILGFFVACFERKKMITK